MADKASRARLSRVKRLAKSVKRVPSSKRRTELLEEMIDRARGDDACGEVVAETIRDLWALGHRRADAPSFLRPFENLVAARRELDGLRDAALTLIRDEQNYPYPCEPPHASADNLSRYRQMQPRVEEATRALMARWETAPSVELPTLLVEHLGLIAWCREAHARVRSELSLTFELQETDLPGWLYGIPFKAKGRNQTASLQAFGMSFEEARALAEDRRVKALNAERFQSAIKKARSAKDKEVLGQEFEVLRLTNDYRSAFGLRRLLWDPRLHAACRIHAEYLNEIQDVIHEQPTAELKTPTLRAESTGYPAGVYENCHLSSTTPEDAFAAWIRSSGHHRGVLLAKPREIGIARFGTAWVENFGLGTDYRHALPK